MNIIAISQSALAAGLFRHQVAAQNLANSSTPGYQPLRVDLRTVQSGGVAARAVPSTPPAAVYDAVGRVQAAPSGVDVATEVAETISASTQVKTSAAMIRHAYETQGTLLDILA